MTSLGQDARVGRLTATEVISASLSTSTVSTTTLRTDNKVLGGDPLNTSLLSHDGSVFYIRHSQVHQIDSLSVANASSEVLITTTASHGLIIGDTFHISSDSVVADSYTIAGLDKADLVGTHVALSVGADAVIYDVGTAASADGFDDVNFLPLVQIDRYKYIDIVDDGVTWLHSTVQPTATRGNVDEVFFS